MKRVSWLALCGLLTVWGCKGTERFSLSIQFPDDSAKEAAQTVTIYSLLPAEGSECLALMSGTVVPGDEGYPVEDEVSISKPATKSSTPLSLGEAGPRLFYAEGFDQDGKIFLKGCESIDWTGDGPNEVVISLRLWGQSCDQDIDCDDGLYCTGDETCVNKICVPGWRECDDNDPCTVDVCNEEQDRCDHDPVTEWQEEGPAGDQSCSDGLDNDCDGFTDAGDTDCTTCGSDAECDDSDPCTDDRCEAGACVNDPITTGCGCGLPPQSASLSCQDPVSLQVSDTSRCSLLVSGGDNSDLENCISCTARVGVSVVDVSDFADGAGACDLDGWTLVTGNNCRDRVENCAIGGGPKSCCDDFSTICDTATFGQPVLRTELNANCGGGVEQWRLQKSFDLGGLTSPWLCFDTAGNQALASSGILVLVEDGQNAAEQVYCQNAMPRAEVDDFLYTSCVDLPAWAAGSPDTRLTFIGHSEGAAESLYLDNITVRGWGGGCARDVVSLLDEEFGGCDLGAWTVSGATNCQSTGCSNQTGWLPGVFGDGGSFSLQRTLDISSIDAELVVCLRLGSDQPAAADSVVLSYHDGLAYQEAWRQTGKLGPDGSCAEVCLNLSERYPGLHRQPSLDIRVEVDSTGAVGIFGVGVSGARFCDAPPSVVDIQSPPSGDGAGNYSFDVVDAQGRQLTTVVRCQIDNLPNLDASGTIRFQSQ